MALANNQPQIILLIHPQIVVFCQTIFDVKHHNSRSNRVLNLIY